MARPMVTSQFVRTRAASPVAIGARVLALIGKGTDSFTVQEAVVRGSGTNDTLGHTATAIVKVGDYKGTAEYVVTTDYILDAGGIKWVGSHKPATGATYYVTYSYAKVAADYDPFLTDDFSEVVTRCGDIELSSGDLTVDSYLTAAAQIAFDIGVRQVIICQIEANTAAEFKDAYDKLENPVDGINPYYIVPLLGSLSASGDFDTAKGTALQHCLKMASEEFGKERRLYTGKKDYVGSGLAVDDFTTEAAALMESRVTLSGNYNPIRVISQPTGSVNVTLDGCFDAVRLAAFRTTQFASDPMMNRPIQGAFTGFETRWGDIEVDTLVDGGVCVSEEISGVIRVVDDITTNTSDEVEIDIATVEARDVLITMNRTAVEGRYKGARGDNSISDQLKSFEDSFLDMRIGEGLIAAKGAIGAGRVPGSLRKWQIAFNYLPVTKVRDIVIKFSVDLGLAI